MKKLLAACTAALRAMGLAGGRASSLPSRRATSRPRLTKVIAGSTTAVLAIGLVVVGVAAPASAHSASIISSDCSVLTVNLTAYAPSVAAVPAQGYTEFEWTKTDTQTRTTSPGSGWVKGAAVSWEYQQSNGQLRWEDSATWNAQPNNNSTGWQLTGNVKYTWTKVTTQWAKTTPDPDWTKTGNTRFHETQAAVPAKTNHVKVTIDSVVKADVDFSATYSSTFTYLNSTSAHNWNVKVTAWDDTQYNVDKSGVSTPCATPATPTYNAAACTAPGVSGNGSYTIPTVAGIKYQTRTGGLADGSGNGYSDQAAGTYTLATGTTIHVIAAGTTGFTLTGAAGPWNFTGTGAGACLSVVTTGVPTFAPEACTGPGSSAAGSYVIPATTGVIYSVSVNGGAFAIATAGPHTAADSDVISVKADAASGYSLKGYTEPWTFTFADSGQCLVKATPVEPTIVSIEKCGTLGSVTPASTTGVSYLVTPAGVTSGAYTVTATAEPGYYIAQDATREWSGNLGKHTECVTPAQPEATAAACDVESGSVTSGYITLPATEGVSYLIDGLDAGPGDHGVKPGLHTVSALADTGYTLEGEFSWSLTVGATGDCFIPVQPAAATPSAEVCKYDSGTLTSGYITIPAAEHVTFKVDGATYTAGKHELAKGDHTVIVTADEGYILVGLASYKVTIDGAGECLTPVTPGNPTAQDQACDLVGGVTDGYITVGDLTNVDYTIDGVPVITVKTIVVPGAHTVVATAKDGYRLIADGEGLVSWKLTVAAAGSCDLPTYAAWDASASATDQLCGVLEPKSGAISVVFPADEPTAVRYFIGQQELTSATTDVAPGTYTVTAVPRYENDTILGTHSWELTVAAAGTDCGELPTFAAWDASASATNQVCNAGSAKSGFISVVFPADDPSAVRYFIGQQELTTANTAVAPGTYTVTAVPRDANDTVLGDNTWTLTVAAVGSVCSELTTLAFTGAYGNLGGMLMLGMFLLIGGAGVYTSTRVRIRKN
ncbi:MAG: peptidase and in, kexin, sedolisin, partial [Microbacteriaceae bacterium]|nr:peptidase and in, kexin, sedolisin [Microbacteriaceae bacterium]